MSFGERLKFSRVKSGMTQGQLAKMLKTTGNSVSNWEQGVSKPYADMLSELCRILNVDSNWLLGRENDTTLTPAAHRVGRAYDRAEPPTQRIVEVALEPFMDQIGTIIGEYSETKNSEVAEEIHFVPESFPLPLYGQLAAAGLGNYLDDDQCELVSFAEAPKRANIAVKISGRSMEPDYHDGDIVFVETDSVLHDGEIGVFNYDGRGLIKKLKLRPLRLVSLNPEFEDIQINQGGDVLFQTIGRVVGRAGA